MSTAVFKERGRVASLTRSRPADDPQLIEARRALAAEKLAAYVSKTCLLYTSDAADE